MKKTLKTINNTDKKENKMKRNYQQEYENILSSYWHKVLHLRELIDTNKDNKPLRMCSIEDRTYELEVIKNKRIRMEYTYSTKIFYLNGLKTYVKNMI